MSKEFLDDDIMGKAYDSRLMNRLLKYAKPYWYYLLLAIIMMIIVTGLELLRPYLLKVTIDDFISGYKKPMYQMEIESPYEGVVFNDNKYVKVEYLEKNNIFLSKSYPIVNIINKDNKYYIGDVNEEKVENRILLDNEDYLKFRDGDIKGINRISVIFLVSIVLAFILNYLQVLILNYTSQRIVFNIRQEIFSHIQNLSISYFDKNPIGRLVTRVTNDTETLNEMYTSVLVNLFKDIFVIVGIMFVMLKMNFTLALISFALIPLILMASIIFRKKIRVVYRLGRAQLAKINATLNENITGMKVIQIFKKENKIASQFDEINRDYLKTSKRNYYFCYFRTFHRNN